MKDRALISMVVCTFLLGCNANQDSVDEFVSHVESQARKEVQQLAPILKFQASKYDSEGLREPFVIPILAQTQVHTTVKKNCWQPSKRSKSGQLERYPISKLMLKGVMGSSGSISALIQTPSGQVVKIAQGQYMGLNSGQVIRVTPKYLLINETLPDGLGCWSKRNVRLALK